MLIRSIAFKLSAKTENESVFESAMYIKSDKSASEKSIRNQNANADKILISDKYKRAELVFWQRRK